MVHQQGRDQTGKLLPKSLKTQHNTTGIASVCYIFEIPKKCITKVIEKIDFKPLYFGCGNEKKKEIFNRYSKGIIKNSFG